MDVTLRIGDFRKRQTWARRILAGKKKDQMDQMDQMDGMEKGLWRFWEL